MFRITLLKVFAVSLGVAIAACEHRRIMPACAHVLPNSAWVTSDRLTHAPKLQDKQDVKIKQPSQAEIKKLINALGDKIFKARESAMARLTEIGLPALGALQVAAKKGDLETQLRAKSIIKKLNAIEVNGLVFKVVTGKEWIAIWNDTTTFSVKLEITNTMDKPCRLALEGKVWLRLKDAKGQHVFENTTERAQAGAGDPISPPLSQNQCYTVVHHVLVGTTGLDKLGFTWQDPFAVRRIALADFKPGTFHLTFDYSNYVQVEEGGAPFWTGSVETIAQSIDISYVIPKK
ncbi:MAG TPA: hypothetical protein VE988_29100 [Gemmataceae bacterium]|nr:hypothetical protein [Gemmataceae bacterium]